MDPMKMHGCARKAFACALLFFMGMASVARADDGCVGPLPDAAWQALVGEDIVLTLRDGSALSGKLQSTNDCRATISSNPKAPSTVVSFAEIERVDAPSFLQKSRHKVRHVGLHAGVSPSLMVDMEWRHFYAYVNVPVVWPASLLGFFLNTGLGATFPVSSGSHWRFDVFANITPALSMIGLGGPFSVGLGVGVGFHYTSPSGLTLGFKVPVLGYAVGAWWGETGIGTIVYYLNNAMAMPVFHVGYRF